MSKRLLVFISLFSVGCASHRIPGTDIEDSSENRAILGVMEKYRKTIESRDAEGLAKLLAPDFRDNAGTADPMDDLTLETIRGQLAERWAKLENVTVELSVRKIKVDGDEADAIYYYTSNFRMPKLSSKMQSEGDIKQMYLRRIDDEWKIVSGI
jgi:hypothetical protein